jgi:hypothetical protein
LIPAVLSSILENKKLTMNFNLEGKRFLVTGAGGGRNIFLYVKISVSDPYSFDTDPDLAF